MKRFITLTAVCLLLAASAQAGWNWTGAYPGAWTNAANWTGTGETGTYPGQVAGDSPIQDSIINDTGTITLNAAIPNTLVPWNNFGVGSGNLVLEIQSSGSITMDNVWFGRNGGTGTLNLNGGSFTSDNGNVQIAQAGAGDATGYVNIYNGGTMTVNTGLLLGESNTANVALVDIADGTLMANDLTINNPGATQNITITDTNGVLSLLGDKVTQLTTFIGNGGLAAGPGLTLTTPTYDGGLDRTIVTAVPEPATMSLLAIGGIALLRRKRR